jgi:hypothetical protein
MTLSGRASVAVQTFATLCGGFASELRIRNTRPLLSSFRFVHDDNLNH